MNYQFVHNNLLFDTAKSEHIGSYRHSYIRGVGSVFVEIYRTPGGRYFYTEGRPARQLHHRVISEVQLKDMIADCPEVYSKIFGEVECA